MSDGLEGELVDGLAELDGGTGSPETRDGLDALPGLVRIAASAWWRTGTWAAGRSLRASRRVAEAVAAPQKTPALLRDAGEEVRRVLLTVAAVTELDRRLLDPASPTADVARRVAEALPAVLRPTIRQEVDAATQSMNGHDASGAPLRERGEDLLRRSRDVRYEEDAHPAYERMLSEIAPDEARILRLLLLQGPQPSVDVRTGGPIGVVRSQLIAPGLNMIGARAGCRYVERVPSYLNNLYRLGLIWFSHETIRDHLRYQVLEAQPEVLDAIHSVRYAKVVRRSIHLTPFGEDFCRVCLSDTSTPIMLPEHSAPREADRAPQPPPETLDP
jgi:hypothetical protein